MANPSPESGLQLDADAVARTVSCALDEDIGTGDLTAELIDEHAAALAEVSTRESCVLCGSPWFAEVFRQLGAEDIVQWRYGDGDAVTAGSVVCTLDGPARVLLTGERTALNFLQLLSGAATTTRAYVDAVRATGARILDTRKTLPGLRSAQKYAVRCGGGENHRQGLYDAILIKENHIASVGGLRQAASAGRSINPSVVLEVEVENHAQLREALDSGVDRVLLDNFSLAQLQAAVKERDANGLPRVDLEASGGLGIDEIRAVARTGVDFVSVGALTKHVKAIDFSMRLV